MAVNQKTKVLVLGVSGMLGNAVLVPALDEGFAVVFAGNVGPGQAVEVMVEAAALLKDVPQSVLLSSAKAAVGT